MVSKHFFKSLAKASVLGCLCIVFLAPSVATFKILLNAITDLESWRALFTNPTVLQGWGLTLWTGISSFLLAISWAFFIIGFYFQKHQIAFLGRHIPKMLALPHSAFAIGFLYLIAPSGWLLRLLSPWATGFESPPDWITSQDPYGIGLILVLAAKETPFLIWTALTVLHQKDYFAYLQQQFLIGQTLSYSASACYWKIIAPQLLKRLSWPLLAVLAYSLTVVDMALVIGPTNPSTLAVQSWILIQDADWSRNQEGILMASLLSLMIAVLGLIFYLLLNSSVQKLFLLRGSPTPVIRSKPSNRLLASVFVRSSFNNHQPKLGLLFYSLPLLYGWVLLVLLIASFSGVWTFPKLWPEEFTWMAWESLGQSKETYLNSITIACSSALTAFALSIMWLELAPARLDQKIRPFILMSLLLPVLLWVLGLHQLSLWLSIDHSYFTVYFGHTLVVLPYTLISLSPAYQHFDPRWSLICASLGKSYAHFMLTVKWPLLKAAFLRSFAVGFAVSMTQYLPTLYLGGGRVPTFGTESLALTLSGQRSLSSTYALALFILVLVMFACSEYFAQPKKFKVSTHA